MAQLEPLNSSFDILFTLCKLCGVYPQSLKTFRKEHILKPSKLGTIIVFVYMFFMLVLYNFLIYYLTDEDRSMKAKQSTLTFVIGLFLNYIAPIMLVVDQCTAVSNQNKIGNIFEQIKLIDERLFHETLQINNNVVKKRINCMIMLTFLAEISIMLATFIFFVDYTKLNSVLWIVSCIPSLFSMLDKIFFASLLLGLKQRFEAINDYLEHLVDNHYKLLKSLKSIHKSESHKDQNSSKVLSTNLSDQPNVEKKRKIFPTSDVFTTTPDNSFRTINNSAGGNQENTIILTSELGNISKINEKLTNFCQLHDEICELGKSLNELWSYPILVLMAYGFLIFTAQLYFLYCGTQGQPIPSLFRSAKSAWITAMYLLYTSGKCIYLIYLSWKTSLESKRTGICLHKCGIAADNNALYEIVNHLSLKLLNHSVGFSACGFFTLDMETLYGVSGGITSYLIILIQFNLAAQQAKDALYTNGASYNETANIMIDDVQNVSSSMAGHIYKNVRESIRSELRNISIQSSLELLSSTSSTTENSIF